MTDLFTLIKARFADQPIVEHEETLTVGGIVIDEKGNMNLGPEGSWHVYHLLAHLIDAMTNLRKYMREMDMSGIKLSVGHQDNRLVFSLSLGEHRFTTAFILNKDGFSFVDNPLHFDQNMNTLRLLVDRELQTYTATLVREAYSAMQPYLPPSIDLPDAPALVQLQSLIRLLRLHQTLQPDGEAMSHLVDHFSQ